VARTVITQTAVFDDAVISFLEGELGRSARAGREIHGFDVSIGDGSVGQRGGGGEESRRQQDGRWRFFKFEDRLGVERSCDGSRVSDTE
jgi:hypothetical protein